MLTPSEVEGDRIAKLMEALAKEEPTELAIIEKPIIEEEPSFLKQSLSVFCVVHLSLSVEVVVTRWRKFAPFAL